MNRKRMVRLVALVVVIFGVVLGAAKAFQFLRPASTEIPTVKVQKGTLELAVFTTGELRTPQTATLVGPQVPGTLQLIALQKTGTPVKAGDVIMEFDPSEQEYNLEQARSRLMEAEQEIEKLKADAAVAAAQDKVALLKARFDVRRAELEVQRNELVGEIDARKNLLSQEEAKRRLAQLEQDVKSRAQSNEAGIQVAQERRNSARLEMMQAQRAIEQMVIKSPIDGLVSVAENRDSTGGFFTWGMTIPEYREGDLVQPGRTVAQVLKVSEMEIMAKIDENDRAMVSPGQPVEVKVDANPGAVYSGKIKTVAGLASRNMWSADSLRKFDATFALDHPDERLRTGQSAQVLIRGTALKDVLFLPRQCLFEKDGKPVLYVKNGKDYVPREVKVASRTESRIAIENLKEGDEVALVNPDQFLKMAKKGGSNGPSMEGSGR